MIRWENRPVEIANLINPSFCAFLIHEMIKGYEEKSEYDCGISYELLFLTLPILLHKPTKEKLPRSIRSYMHTWLQSNPEVRIGYAKRARELVPYTKEATKFLTARDLLIINNDGSLSTSSKRLRLNMDREVNLYLTDYQAKAKLLGKWFAVTGTSSTIYTMWGISP
ncbi:three component ABC system middle component [Bacillus sp. ISL-39]|uniref:three component ABC system middle component n=1 Tax=Bacillus sp. ISL-39 TaxID=2819124 RepID=UPI001BE5899B|nr:three component ABC system middle component [Bacillus sp. ISL-39]MBT2639449.1 hypothetical protein [Bacillus sp. ISL-39]